jgi:hypothetical protein
MGKINVRKALIHNVLYPIRGGGQTSLLYQQLVAGFNPRPSGLDPRLGHLGFVVDQVELGQAFFEYFVSPDNFYSTNCSVFINKKVVSVKNNFIIKQQSYDIFENITRRTRLIGVSTLNELNKANYSDTTILLLFP